MGEHKGIDGAHHVEQQHFCKKRNENARQGHRTLWRLHNAECFVIMKEFHGISFLKAFGCLAAGNGAVLSVLLFFPVLF